jgi:CBS domain-containing protein
VKRWLYHYETVRGRPEVLDQMLRAQVRHLLMAVSDDGAELTPEGDLLIMFPTRVLGRDMHKIVRLHTGVAEQHGNRTCIPVRWAADPARHVFPSFEGTIELEPQSFHTANLALVGAAKLPLGAVGAALDATVLPEVAERALAHVVEVVARELEQATSGPPPPVEQERTPDQLPVRSIMTPDPLVLQDDMPLRTAALLLFHYDVSGAPVRTAAGGLVGVLSETDLLDVEAPMAFGFGRDVEDSRRRQRARTVGAACSGPAHEISPEATVRHAAGVMRDRDVGRLVVVDGSDIVGVVSRHDVLKALLRNDVETQAAVDHVLTEYDGQVVADVQWGIARVSGQVDTRSAAAEVAERIERVDGIVGVDSEITWETDDTVAIRQSPLL